MAERVRLAAAQLAATPGDVRSNLRAAVESIREAAARRAALVVLPEFCISGFEWAWVREGAPGGGIEPSGPAMREIADATAEAPVTVVFNDLERSDGGLYSTSYVLVSGALAASHRKTILTEGERSAGLTPGDSAAVPVTTPTLPVPLGPMVCFEHGFPEIALDLAMGGAGVLTISSAIKTGTEYLRNLRTRARAQDNGCYVVASNAVGNGYCGESMIVDPRGQVLTRGSGTAADLVIAEMDPDLITRERIAEPVLALRRPDLRRYS